LIAGKVELEIFHGKEELWPLCPTLAKRKS